MRIAESTSKILSNIPLPQEVTVIHRQAAILDIGSCTTRVGFAGDDTPRIDQPTCVVKGTGEEGAALCLAKAYAARASADVCPVKTRGEVDWDAMEQLLCHLAKLLELDSKELHTPLLFTENMLVPRAQRQKLTEIMMEKHAVEALYFAPSPVLALYAAGICSGMSVEMGYNACHVVPVFQGYPLFHAVHALDYGGDYFTRYMMSTGPRLPDIVHPRHRYDVWAYLKEKYCETCKNSEAFNEIWEKENAKNENSSSSCDVNSREGNNVVNHSLPDGTVITLGARRFLPAEMLINPLLASSEAAHTTDHRAFVNMEQLPTFTEPKGLHELIVDSIAKCDYDISSLFYGAVHFSGGSSLLRGLPGRIGMEVGAISEQEPDIIFHPERRNAAFLGGSILASLPTTQNLWVKRGDYEEFGSSAVFRRCF